MTQKEKTGPGPSLGYQDVSRKRALWEEIALEQKGEFKITFNSGRELEIHHLIIPYKNHMINLSVSDTHPLKFQLSFASIQDFELVLGWKDFLESLLEKFRKSRIKTGWKEFDTHYVINSNRPDFVRRVLTKEIQQVFLRCNIYSLSYQTDSKTRNAGLISIIQMQVGDKNMIRELIEAFKLLIDHLEKTKIVRTK